MNPISFNNNSIDWTNTSNNVITWKNSSLQTIDWRIAQGTNNIYYADFVRLTTRNRYSPPFTIGQEYTILSLGTTDFTAIGADSNTVGTVFTATEAGSGTGVATQPAVYGFSTAPSTIVVGTSGILGSSSFITNYYPGYEIYLYSQDGDPTSFGFSVGQYISGNHISPNTQITYIGFDEDVSTYYLTLNNPVTTADTINITVKSYNTAPLIFDGLGQLVNVGAATRDIKSTANETSFTLVGIDTSMLSLVLGTDIKGSQIEAWHGFFNANGQLLTLGGMGGLYKFFTGYINSFAISEQWMEELRMYVGTVSVTASSIQLILRNKVAGRYTNDASWQLYDPGDNSMNRVAFISSINYQFGKTT